MPRSNIVHPLIPLDHDEHILFKLKNDRLLRVVFKSSNTAAVEQVEDCENSESNQRSITLLMFIHGVGGSLDIWQNQLKASHEAGFNVLAVDLLGHGGSSKPVEKHCYVFENLANDLIDLFDSYKMEYNYLIGHSYGTSFCTYMSAERDIFIHGLVLISGGSPSPLLPDSCSMFKCPLSFLTCVHTPLVSHYKRLAFYKKTPSSLALKNAPIQVSPQVLHDVMQGQVWPDGNEAYHARLTVPVLVLAGRQDNLVSISDESYMHETLPNSEIHIIEDAGHMVMIEQPNQVNEHLLEFLNESMKSYRNGAIWSTNASCTSVKHGSQEDSKSPSSHSQLSRNRSLNNSVRSLRKGKTLY